MPFRRTKIVCTIGPASASPKILRKMVDRGMDVARLNFSHGTREGHQSVIQAIRQISKERGKEVGILQDLAGPKIRVGGIQGGSVVLKPRAELVLTSREVPGDEREVSVSLPALPSLVKEGDTILLSDGALELKVLSSDGQDIRCRVVVGGWLGAHKGINLPATTLSIPALTDKDREDMELGIREGVDFMALSFVRDASDLEQARQILKERGAEIPFIAKIEKHEALDHLDEIVAASDGLMVARGDLGVEIPLENVPMLQKTIIAKANQAGKPVITATQMLGSMVENPRPTRAEVTDVANALLDGTDAVMLSEETAVGRFPAEAVAMMARIALRTERSLPEEGPANEGSRRERKRGDISEAISHATRSMAIDIAAKAIITCTTSGSTARQVSKYRPPVPIVAVSPHLSTVRRLSLSWGVLPMLSPVHHNTDDMIDKALDRALQSGILHKGDAVVITAGIRAGVPGSTNLLKATVL
ncbi:MAG: pyruvate kinase [candidate division NC10 bacterium]|nr:pyruvate kinase [candidate division NC10 bacterium]